MGKIGKHKSYTVNRLKKTRKRTIDMDQIYEHIQPENVEKVTAEKTQFNEDLPGLGKYYCISCEKYFIGKTAMEDHNKSKLHKRR
jgi:bud site selection protein 20